MEYKMVKIDRIKRHTVNLRQKFRDPDYYLYGSIKRRHEEGKRGVIFPILVRKLQNDPKYDYELIDGDRRLQASLAALLEEIPILEVTGEEDPRELMILSYSSNEGRLDFTWIEKAMYFKNLHDLGMTLEEIGKRPEINLSKQRISTYITAYELGQKVPTSEHLELETAYVILNPLQTSDSPVEYTEEEAEELAGFAVQHKLSRSKVVNILGKLFNFYASLDKAKEWDESLYEDLFKKYYWHRFYPQMLEICEKERKLRMGEVQPKDKLLSTEEYRFEDDVKEYAEKYHGELIDKINISYWRVSVLPYNEKEVEEEYEKCRENIE